MATVSRMAAAASALACEGQLRRRCGNRRGCDHYFWGVPTIPFCWVLLGATVVPTNFGQPFRAVFSRILQGFRLALGLRRFPRASARPQGGPQFGALSGHTNLVLAKRNSGHIGRD